MKNKNYIVWVIKNWEEIVSVISVTLMFVVCCITVFARYIFNYGIAWSTEICNICLLYTTFIGGAAAYKRNQHFGMDFITDRLSDKPRYVLKLVINFVLMVMFFILTYLSFIYTVKSKKVMNISRIPYKYADLAALLGFASMAIYSTIFFVMGIVDHKRYYKKFVVSQAQLLQGDEKEEEL